MNIYNVYVSFIYIITYSLFAPYVFILDEHGATFLCQEEGRFQHYGTSLLAEVVPDVVPRVLGKYHFVEGPVSRITAAVLSPKSFAIAYRLSSVGREASVSLAPWRR